jgi:hypothetical protein
MRRAKPPMNTDERRWRRNAPIAAHPFPSLGKGPGVRFHHLGAGFDVWHAADDQQAWFWLVLSPRRDSGIIGSAATEADAIREACASIEEASSQPRADPAAWRIICAGGATLPADQSDSIIFAAWKQSLANLERHLASQDGASV